MSNATNLELIENTSHISVIDAMERHFSTYGFAKFIHCDQQTSFKKNRKKPTNDVFQDLRDILGIMMLN